MWLRTQGLDAWVAPFQGRPPALVAFDNEKAAGGVEHLPRLFHLFEFYRSALANRPRRLDVKVLDYLVKAVELRQRIEAYDMQHERCNCGDEHQAK